MATNRMMIDELVLRGADDWVMATDVAWLAKSIGGAVSDEEILRTAIGLVRTVLDEGLMRAGEVSDGGFFEWDIAPEEAVGRVERNWRALGRLPDLGEVCWLANTESGDHRAQALSDRRDR